jgi:hypothetical protein
MIRRSRGAARLNERGIVEAPRPDPSRSLPNPRIEVR